MALKAIQFYDSNFFSQLGAEYICTGFMFDDALQAESMDYQQTLANQITVGPGGSVLKGAAATAAAEQAMAQSTGGASAPGGPSMGAGGTSY